jgi:hypothetical protein
MEKAAAGKMVARREVEHGDIFKRDGSLFFSPIIGREFGQNEPTKSRSGRKREEEGRKEENTSSFVFGPKIERNPSQQRPRHSLHFEGNRAWKMRRLIRLHRN